MYSPRTINVLVADRESPMQAQLRFALEMQGFTVNHAETSERALVLIRQRSFDAVLLDIDLPRSGGIEVSNQIRKLTPRTGIIMMTVADAHEESVFALDAGADDCVSKPFTTLEVAARIRALVRRKGVSETDASGILQAGVLRMDSERRMVWKDGTEISLSPKEFDLLAVFLQSGGVILKHSDLLGTLWGPGCNEVQYLRTYVRRLRLKIEKDPENPQYIVTESWFGYRFNGPAATRSRSNLTSSVSERKPAPSYVPRCRIPPDNLAELSALRISELRDALRANTVSFPSQVPTFERHDRPDLQRRAVQLYFVLGWNSERIAKRYGLTDPRIRQILKTWKRRAIETGYLEFIPPSGALNVAVSRPGLSEGSISVVGVGEFATKSGGSMTQDRNHV